MSSKNLTKITLNNTKNFLVEEKTEIYAMLKDPNVAEWQHFSFEKNAASLKLLGISTKSLIKTLKEYPQSAREISKKIDQWHNDVGNQLADLPANKDADLALKNAQTLEAQAKELQELKSKLKLQISILPETAKLIRHSLSMKELVSLAKKSPGIKSSLFEAGLATLSLVTDDFGSDPSQKSIGQINSEANKLATRFTHIEMPRVPRLAEEIIFHYISVGVSTTKAVTTFIKNLKGQLAGELNRLERIKVAIAELHNQNTEGVLQGIKAQASSLGQLICGLQNKRHLKKNLDTINDTLEFLNIYQLVLKKKLLPALSDEINNQTSDLNPTTKSVLATKDFFLGAKGIIRSVKMMVTSLKGNEAINELELQIIVETALNKCSVYYGKSSKDIKKLNDFIHGLVNKFKQPFPYDDIFAMTKTIINTYGTEIERYLNKYAIPPELKSLSITPIPGKFGILFKNIKDQKATFHKANTKK